MTIYKKLTLRHRVTEPELPWFFDLIRGKGYSKNKPTCENAVSQTLYGSCTLHMGSWQRMIYTGFFSVQAHKLFLNFGNVFFLTGVCVLWSRQDFRVTWTHLLTVFYRADVVVSKTCKT